jgi:hypothetical protein
VSARPAPRLLRALPGLPGSGRRIVALMSDHDDTTPDTAPDGSTNITDEQAEHTEKLGDGSKDGLVDDDKDSDADKA